MRCSRDWSSDVCSSDLDVPACDTLAEDWGNRELLPAGKDADARADVDALALACDEHDVSSACMGAALMYKYGTAYGRRDKATSDKYWARVKELGDLNGFKGERPSPAGRAALDRAHKDCEAGRRRACAQVGWAAFVAVQQDKDVTRAYPAWRKACDLGSGLGCRWAGHVAHTYPEIRDPAAAE